jgi:hypothetical protein
MLKLQRVFFENLSTLISFSDVLEMNKSILFDSLCLALLKSRKILRGECYSEFLDFELESEGFLRKIVLDRIEKRMSLNFKSEFIDLIYYQSFENCLTICEIEPSEPSKIDKLECCGKVLLHSLSKELSQRFYINNYKLLVSFLYQLIKYRSSSHFKLSKKEIVYAIFRKFLLSKYDHPSSERLIIFMQGFYILIHEHIQKVFLHTIDSEKIDQAGKAKTKEKQMHSFIYNLFAEYWFIEY